MASIRYRTDYKNIDRVEVPWRLDIYDTDITELTHEVNTSKITRAYHGLTREIKPGIIPSSLTVGLKIDANELGFLEQVRDSTENRFYFKLYENTTNINFIGRIATDNIVFQDAPRPGDSELTATDGLVSLKKLDFQDATYRTILDWIKEAFNQIDILSQYPSATTVFTVGIDLYETSMKNFTDNPLTMSRVKGTSFFNNTDDPKSGIKWWDVLENIAVAFNLRIYYDNGIYRIEQIPQKVGTSYAIWTYDNTFTLTGTSTFSSEKEIDHDTVRWVSRGNSYRYLPPLKRVFLLFNYRLKNITTDLSWDQGDQTEKNLGWIQVKSLEDKLIIKGIFTTESTMVDDVPGAGNFLAEYPNHLYVLKVTVRLNDGLNEYGLLKSVSFDPPGSFGAPVFTPQYFGPLIQLNTVDTYISLLSPLWHASLFLGPPPTFYYSTIGSPAIQVELQTQSFIPGAIGTNWEVFMKVELVGIFDPALNDIQLDPDINFFWSFTDVELYSSAQEPGGTIEFGILHESLNPVEGTYEDLEIKTVIGDAPNSDREIQILNADDEWVPSREWRPNADTGNVHQLLTHTVRDLMAIRKAARQIYQGTIFIRDFTFGSRLDYRSIIYIPLNGEYESPMDAFSGEILEIALDDISDTTGGATNIEYPGDVPVLGPGPMPPDWPPIHQVEPPGFGILSTNEPIDVASTHTVIDIVNPMGVEIAAGEFVIVFNTLTGEHEILELAADIIAASTTMTVISHTFSTGFPVGTPISVTPVEHLEWVTEDFVATGGETFVTVTGPLPNNTIIPAEKIWDRARVMRGGAYRRYSAAPTKMHDHGILKASERITFAIPLIAGEWIRVEYKIPKV